MIEGKGKKPVSVFQIINKVYRDMGASHSLNMADAIEWAGEALEFIGAPPQYNNFVIVCKVQNRKVKLPINLHYIEGTKGYPTEDLDNCPSDSAFIPMRYTTDSFFHRYCEGNTDTYCQSSLTYGVNDDYMQTSFETGFIMLSFTGIPVDENGYPTIPDNVKYKNAVSYHIMEKLGFILKMQGKLSSEDYSIISRNRDWYIGAANSSGQMPSMDEMESIKNDWLRLIPKLNHHSDGFATQGEPEMRINHTTITGISRQGVESNNPTFFNYEDSAE